MKNSVNALLVTIAFVGAQAAVPFEGGGSAPEWSWAAAQSAIESVDTRTAREELQRMAMAGNDKALTERIDLEPGVVINTPALEWHVFEWQPGGHVELLFIYGQVENIRPEDMEKDA